jgi:molecular chaperone GrpE (heat shock protein)
MEQTFGDLEKNSKGFAMRPGTNQFVPLNQSLPTLMKQYKGDLSAMQQAGRGEGSLKLYRALNVDTVFRSAEAKKAGSGEAAVKSHLEKIMMPEGAEDFNKEYQESQKDAAIRLQEAITRIKSSLMDKLLPVVEEKLIPAFSNAEPQILKFIDAFVKAIESMKNVDLVGIFTTIAQGIGAAMYHILNIMKKTGMINIDDKSLESLRVQSNANRTGTALANAPSNVVEGIFNAIPFGQYLKWTPTSMTIRGAAAAAKWAFGGDDNAADANAENFKQLTGPQPTQGPLLPENPFANSPEIKQLTQSMDRTATALDNYWYNNTPDRMLPMSNRPPTG